MAGFLYICIIFIIDILGIKPRCRVHPGLFYYICSANSRIVKIIALLVLTTKGAFLLPWQQRSKKLPFSQEKTLKNSGRIKSYRSIKKQARKKEPGYRLTLTFLILFQSFNYIYHYQFIHNNSLRRKGRSFWAAFLLLNHKVF